jgi:predicted ATPase/class 3 adenylate cyclase
VIFISHSSRNNDKAIAVRDWLVEQGWGEPQIYLDLDNINPGEPWRQALNAIGSKSDAVIACLSDDWLRSPECLREFNHAESGGKPIFPVVVEQITEKIPRFITDLQFADIADPVLKNEGFERLRRGLLAAGIGPHMDSGGRVAQETPQPRSLPSGTVAFLFTDIEGSTVRWDRSPAAMQIAVGRHDGLMRAAIAKHEGHVFKTIGDAFCAVFRRVDEAIGAALEAQIALAETDFSEVGGLRVRMAIHVGMSEERDADYFGPTLNRVARLLAIGHGGQVLLSGTAASIAASGLPASAGLKDLGEHRLKNLSARERVFQLTASGLESEFPKLLSLELNDTNLPEQFSSFVGRDNVVAEIERLLGASRLVTLFGAGGLGKTRCAKELGKRLLVGYDDGVWFVDFAPVNDPTRVASEIATIFGVPDAPNTPMLATLAAHLERKHALLLLDNCEHVVSEAAKTAAAILAAAPRVKIVATSREVLNVSGEAIYRMPTLAVPERRPHIPARTALTYGAVQLFEDRARAANQAFRVTDDNAPIIAEICRRLDGIPLAIELAAARMRMLSPSQLEKQLKERFRVLTGGDRTALPRQRTMRALIDWSYDLLSEQERRLCRDVSIFAGSFSVQTAMAVCASEEIDEFAVMDLLSCLIDKSLVVAESSDLDARCRVLESIREYSREKSVQAGEAVDLARRHATAFADLAERLEHDYDVSAHEPWLQQTASEDENILAALAWSFGSDGEALVGQRLAATLRRVLMLRAAEARRWVATALDVVSSATPPQIVARLELSEATLATTMSQYRAALPAAQRALATFEQLGDARGLAIARRWAGRSLIYLGQVDGDIGQVEKGEALLEESLEILRGLGFRRVGGILRDLGTARALKDDVCEARPLFAQALISFRESRDEHNVAVTAGTLADAEFRCGDVQAALVAGREGLATARAHRLHGSVVGWLLNNLAAFSVEAADYDEARNYAHELLHQRHDGPMAIDVTFALQHLAGVAALRPEAETEGYRLAATLLGFVDARLSALGVTREYTEHYLYEKIQNALRVGLESAALAELTRAGGALELETAVALALTVQRCVTSTSIASAERGDLRAENSVVKLLAPR